MVTNTSIVGLPGGVVVQQAQATLDKQGQAIDGDNSELYIAASDDDLDDSDFDSQENVSILVQ